MPSCCHRYICRHTVRNTQWVNSIIKLQLPVSVVVPLDNQEPASEVYENLQISRFKYGFLSKGKLAFGSGMLPNLRRNPLLLLQVPIYILQTIRTALKLRTRTTVLHANWSLPLIAAWLLHRFWKLPYVVTIRGEDFRLLKNRLFRILLSPAIEQAHAIISVNESFVAFFKETMKLPASKVLCIPNGVAVPEISPEQAQNFKVRYSLPAAPLIGYVGTVIPRKQIEILIKSLAQAELQTTHLILVGRLTDITYLHQLRADANKLGVQTRVHFLGPLPPQEIPMLLSVIDVYVSASAFEGRPNAVLEALAAGKPAVVSKIDAHQEVIVPNQNGFLCANIQEFAAAISNILNDNSLLKRMSQQAKLSVANKSWENCAKQYVELYTQMAQQAHENQKDTAITDS